MKKMFLVVMAIYVVLLIGCATTGKNYGLGAFEYDKKPLAVGEAVVGKVEAKAEIFGAQGADQKYAEYEKTQEYINKTLSGMLEKLEKEAKATFGEKAELRNVVIKDFLMYFAVNTTYYTATAEVVLK